MGSWDNYEGDGNVTRLPLAKLDAVPADLPDPATIPPRPWLLGSVLQRRQLTMLAAAGGTGKTALNVTIALSLASGRPLLGLHVFERVPVWFLSLEDDRDEINRRIAAGMIHHGIDRSEVSSRLFVHTQRERRICMARLDPGDGTTIVLPDLVEIVTAAHRRGIGCIVVDPFVKSHELDENDNGAMDELASAGITVASEIGCAVLIAHHVRKGVSNGVEGARGAGSLVAAARIGVMLSGMTSETAEALDVPAAERRFLLRLDAAKVNQMPPQEATWFRLVNVDLPNAEIDMHRPSGDGVQTVEPWRPTTPWTSLPAATIASIFEQLRKGPSPGEFYSAHANPKAYWAGNLVVAMAGLTQAQARIVLRIWLANEILVEDEYASPARHRHARKRVLPTAKAAEITAGISPPNWSDADD